MKQFVKISTVRKRFGKGSELKKRSMRQLTGGANYDVGIPTNPAETAYKSSDDNFDQINFYYGLPCPSCGDWNCIGCWDNEY